MGNKKAKPKEITVEEAREELINEIVSIVKFNAKGDPEKLELLSTTVHQILAMLDGNTMDLPGYEVCPISNTEDKDYLKKMGKNYYPKKRQDIGEGILAGRFAMKLNEEQR